MHFILFLPKFWFLKNFGGFSKLISFCKKIWVFNEFKTSCIASLVHYNNVSCILDVFTLLLCYVLVGLDWAKPMRHLNLHVTCSCIFMHMYHTVFIL